MLEHLNDFKNYLETSKKHKNSVILSSFLIFLSPSVLFLGLCFIIFGIELPKHYNEADFFVANTLLIVSILFPFPYFFVSHLYSKTILKPDKLALLLFNNSSNLNKGDLIFTEIHKSLVFKWALFEGAAVLGIGSLFFSAYYGLLQTYYLYWFNLIPVFVFLIVMKTNWPTKEKYLSIYKDLFLSVD